MQYEREMIEELLRESGINHRLDNRIKPNKHPYMKKLEVALKINGVNYMYFPQTDSLAVTQVDIGRHNLLCHTLMMPSEDGISILMVVNQNDDIENVMEGMAESLDKIIPEGLSYNILGII
tara:strand:+ start:528 stop:890 length:363 start_codon:yes stop_codon:yes gene_type:complete